MGTTPGTTHLHDEAFVVATVSVSEMSSYSEATPLSVQFHNRVLPCLVRIGPCCRRSQGKQKKNTKQTQLRSFPHVAAPLLRV